jgi:PPK2 family polyphosphate:nucleotide phosphotransferase
MKISTDEYLVKAGGRVRLGEWPTSVKPVYSSEENYKELLEHHVKQMSERQGFLYANGRNSVLLIFQGMDASGKDGAIRHVMSGLNPQGCEVFSFKEPSRTELAHDFLWRTTCCLPERGRIGIFNRSYYEEVLVVRVHPELLQAESLPKKLTGKKRFWEKRMESITDLEKHLHRNGTQIVKFFLHISQEEQRERFLRRIEDPARNWKFSAADIKERAYWKDYMAAYEACFAATSSKHSPWFIIPADDKLNARLLISQVVLNTLEQLKMKPPSVDPKRRKELFALGKMLENKRG